MSRIMCRKNEVDETLFDCCPWQQLLLDSVIPFITMSSVSSKIHRTCCSHATAPVMDTVAQTAKIQEELFNTVVERMRRVHGPFSREPKFVDFKKIFPTTMQGQIPRLIFARIERHLHYFYYTGGNNAYLKRNKYITKSHLLWSLAKKRNMNYSEDMLNTYLKWSATYVPVKKDNRYIRMERFLDIAGAMF